MCLKMSCHSTIEETLDDDLKRICRDCERISFVAGRQAVDLHKAAGEGRHEELKEVLSVLPERANERDRVRIGGLAAVCVGVPSECRVQYDKTPLHWVAFNGDTKAARALLDAKADPNAADKVSAGCLHGWWQGWLGVRVLSECRVQEGCTPLHDAAHEGHIEAVQVLLDARADLNATNWMSAGCMHGWWQGWLGVSVLSECLTQEYR